MIVSGQRTRDYCQLTTMITLSIYEATYCWITRLNLHCCGVILTIQQRIGLFSSPERGHTCTDSPETVESQTNLLSVLMGVSYVSVQKPNE